MDHIAVCPWLKMGSLCTVSRVDPRVGMIGHHTSPGEYARAHLSRLIDVQSHVTSIHIRCSHIIL